MSEPYLTIQGDVTVEVIIKKSRFICQLKKLTNEQDAIDFIEAVNHEHRKATHNCFAYQVGDRDEIQRESDNGEPSGTAGVPILEVLQKNHLHNVAAVVTRYFGGIKLGAGGLIRAYSGTTAQAVEAATIVQRVTQTIVGLQHSYANHDQLTYWLNQEHFELDHDDYGVDVTTYVFVDNDHVETFTAEITDRFRGQIAVLPGEERQHKILYQP